MHEDGWYGRDPRNRLICTCIFFVTVVITGAWLLRLYAENLASFHNRSGWRVFHVMNVEKDQVVKLSAEIRNNLLSRCNWKQRSGMICSESILSGTEVSERGRAPRYLRASELLGWKCPRGEVAGSGVTDAFRCLELWHNPVRVKFWPLQIARLIHLQCQTCGIVMHDHPPFMKQIDKHGFSNSLI